MTTLAEKLAARAADNVNKTDPVTPPVVENPPVEEPTVPVVEVTPTVEHTPAFQEESTKVEPAIPSVVNDSNEVMEYKKKESAESAVTATYPRSSYSSPANSRRGYQWQWGIMRPNAEGIYTPKDAAEELLCEVLVADGYLQLIK